MQVSSVSASPTGRDTPLSPGSEAESARQGNFQVTEKNYLARPAAPPRQLQRLLMHTHSRGVMMHAIGAATLYPEVLGGDEGDVIVSARPYLFGAPAPRGAA